MSGQQPERRPGNGDGQEAPRDSANPDTLQTGQTQSTTESSANTDYTYDPSDQFIQWNTISGAVASSGDVPPDRRGEQQSSEYDPNLIPNPKFLAQMVEMGIPEASAIQALIHTKNYSAGKFSSTSRKAILIINLMSLHFLSSRNGNLMGL